MTADATAEPVVVTEQLTGGIAVVRLNRPERLNAMTWEMFDAVTAALDCVAANPDCRVVILTGTGRAFSAGGDLDATDVIDGNQSSLPRMRGIFEASSAMISRVQSIPQPVIAAIKGPATGGGISLALAADTRICGESARFSAAFVRIGLAGCEMGISYLLPRIISPTVAFEMMLSGRLVGSAEAHRLGLVSDVVPDDELMDHAVKLAKTFIRNSPIALWMTKKVMWENLDASSLTEAMSREAHAQMLCGHTDDHREAIAAFRAKREAVFHNK